MKREVCKQYERTINRVVRVVKVSGVAFEGLVDMMARLMKPLSLMSLCLKS